MMGLMSSAKEDGVKRGIFGLVTRLGRSSATFRSAKPHDSTELLTIPRLLLVPRSSVFALLLGLICGLTSTGCVFLSPRVQRTNGIPYGMRGERTLSLDVIRPEHPNGLGVLLLVSGGWKSRQPGKFPTWPLAPVLRRGYTVFDIYHVSQPQATVRSASARQKAMTHLSDAVGAFGASRGQASER